LVVTESGKSNSGGVMSKFKKLIWLPAFAVIAALGAFGGFAVAGAFERAIPTPLVKDVSLHDLPDEVPIAGPDGPSGYVTKKEIERMLDLNPLNLDQIEPGVSYEQPLIGPTVAGTIDVIGTRSCVVELLESGGRRQNCFEEHRNENSLYVQDSFGAFVPRN
jgi:hypothetical protein